MRYYKKLSLDGYILALEKRETTTAGIEIAEAEYKTLLSEIQEKTDLANQLYKGEITIDDVQAEWREEIQRRVDERLNEIEDDPDLTDEEALDIILGGGANA